MDITKVREALKSRYTGYGDNGNMLLCYTEEQRNIVKDIITDYERLLKKETPMRVINNFMVYCPNCKEQLITGKTNYHYCLECGQKLDFGVKKND